MAGHVLAAGLGVLPGLMGVEPDAPSGRLTVEYDLFQVTLAEIVEVLAAIGFPPAEGVAAKARLGMLLFAEKNEIDHLRHVAHCCSKSPK